MKMLYALASVLAITGCGIRNNTANVAGTGIAAKAAEPLHSDAEATESTDAGAAKALKDIYDDVFGWYEKAENNLSLLGQMPDFNALYMSADYKKVLREVEAIDKDCEADGMIGFFDYDHWVDGQDFKNLSLDIMSLSGAASGKCRAEVVITNLGVKKRVGIDMVLENGKWKIDDFCTDGSSEKARMREYVAGDEADTDCASLDWSDKNLWFDGQKRLDSAHDSLPDVFYLLPTCVTDWTDGAGNLHHNADPANPAHREAWQLSAELADTIFATRANMFMPYYRQATFEALEGDAARAAGRVAVGDVLDAFDYYMKHYNRGRRFVLAGYSQGGQMVKEVLKHIDDDTYSRLIAAYVVGYGVTASDTVTLAGHNTPHIKLANDSMSRGVTVNFNSVTSPDAMCPLLCNGNIGCINPVSWTTTGIAATLLEAGAKPLPDDTRFPYATAAAPRNNATAVTVSVDTAHNVLVVKGIDAGRYAFAPLENFFPVGNLHLQELFFYGDCLRRNVLLRSGMK